MTSGQIVHAMKRAHNTISEHGFSLDMLLLNVSGRNSVVRAVYQFFFKTIFLFHKSRFLLTMAQLSATIFLA